MWPNLAHTRTFLQQKKNLHYYPKSSWYHKHMLNFYRASKQQKQRSQLKAPDLGKKNRLSISQTKARPPDTLFITSLQKKNTKNLKVEC